MSPGPDQLAAAQQALADLGVTMADLQTHGNSPTPTFGEYLPTVVTAAGHGASRTCGTYWARMATTWADRRVDEVQASDIEVMKNTAATTPPATADTPTNTSSARAIYNRAIASSLIDQKDSPAHRVVKPR